MTGLVTSIFGGGSSGGQQSTNTVTNQPPAYLQPYLTSSATSAQNAYNTYTAGNLNAPYTGAPGQTAPNIAAVSPQATASDLAAQSQDTNVANSIAGNMQQTQGVANNLNTQVNNGTFMAPSKMTFNPTSDASLNSSIAGAVAPLQQNLQENILPSLQSTAIADGAYGGSRQGIVNENALQNFSNSENQAAAQADLSMEEQNNSLSAQNIANQMSAATTGNAQTLSADSEIPSLQSAAEQQGLDVGNIESGVGAAQRGFDTANIAANEQNYAQEQAAPYGGLGELESLLMGTASGGTSTSSVPQPGLLSQAAGALGSLNGFASAANSSGLTSGASSALSSAGSWLSNLFNSAGPVADVAEVAASAA